MANLVLDPSETFKYAYNHPSLAAIYAIENIDVRTIRRLDEPAPILEKVQSQADSSLENLQSELDFGEGFRTWMPPLVLDEPIQVLQLSSQAEKILSMHQKQTLRSLIELSQRNFAHVRGMGQGHIDEIKQKLQKYLEKNPAQKSRKIDFASFVRTLIGSLPHKHLFVFLETFGLQEFCSLSAAESSEIKRWSASERLALEQKMRSELGSSENLAKLESFLREIVQVFIKPWMYKRQGLATQDELIERLQRSSRDPHLVLSTLNFFNSTFFKSQFSLKPYLHQIGNQLYSLNHQVSKDYAWIEQKAFSYFYKKNIFYSLEELVLLLQKEFVQTWNNYSNEFILKVLYLSPCFYIRKENCGRLIIRLA